MKVGVLVQFTSKTDIEAKFTELKELGVDSCQLVCWDRPTLHDDVMVEKINKAIEKFGIRVTAFWCGWESGNFTEAISRAFWTRWTTWRIWAWR